MKPKIIVAVWIIVGIFCSQAAAQTYDTNDDSVQTFAGSGFSGYADGVGQLTMFKNPNGVAADAAGNLFVLDVGNSRVRKITPDGTVSTFVGGGNQWPAGTGTNASLSVDQSSSITVDHSGVVWIATAAGYLIRIGTNASMSADLLNGPSGLTGVCVDSSNNVYVSDYYGQKIWRRGTNADLEVFAGSGNSGAQDGNGIFSSFNLPAALASDAADNIYVWDSGNHKIRRIHQNGDVVTLTGGSSINADGQNPSFSAIAGMCVDSLGNLILACGGSIRAMSVTTNGVTLAGSFTQLGYTNGIGSLARFNGALGVCASGDTLYIADTSNQRIRSLTENSSAQPVSPANLQLSTYPGLQIIGTVGRTYQIQISPDLNTWTPRATLLLNSSPYLWIDQNPVNGNKFYRAYLLP